MRRRERYRIVKMEAEARRVKEKVDYELQREDRVRETEVKTMKKSLKRQQKKAKKKMAVKMNKLAKVSQVEGGEDRDAAGLENNGEAARESDESEQGKAEQRPKVFGRFVRKH